MAGDFNNTCIPKILTYVKGALGQRGSHLITLPFRGKMGGYSYQKESVES